MHKVSGLLASLSGVALLFGAAACGDDGDSGGSSGVSGSKTGSELTDADVKKLCEWTNSIAYEPSKKEACTAVGAGTSSDKASCEALVMACEAQDASSDDEDDDCSKETAKENIPEGCKATVSEIESCIRSLNDLMKQQYTSASCENAGKGDDSGPELPASCKTLETKCPGFLGGDSGDDAEEIACPDGSGTYTSDDKCDDFEDCEDGSDEQGC